MALEITTGNFVNEVLEAKGTVLIDFWATWCGPCRMVSPIIDELHNEYGDRVVIGKMDVDNNDEVVSQFGVRNIPTVVFLKDGKMVDKIVGATTKDKFVAKIEALLK